MKKLLMIPLGGLGEIGRNSTIWEYENQIVVVDAGLKFPGEGDWGVDYLIPDFSYLKNKKVLAVILTHSHEDHVGALAYLLREVKAPIYGTPLTLGLAEHRLKEQGIDADLIYLKPEENLNIGPFHFEFAQVSHSIPDGVGYALNTSHGLIVHSGDFKIDNTPVDGQYTDLARFTEWGKRGVNFFMSDSTNADEPGQVKSEKIVGKNLDSIFSTCKGLVVVTTFASNVHRVNQVAEYARKNGRKVAVDGRAMHITIETARKLGYLKSVNDVFISMEGVSRHPRNKVVVLTTGSQGEPMSVLRRIASREYKKLQLEKGDFVIISADPIPGNERSVNSIINTLMWQGVEVFHSEALGVHTSGHAKQEELKLLLSLVKPKYFMPVHGEERHLVSHARLAEEMLIHPQRILLLRSGDKLEIIDGKIRVVANLSLDNIYVDGLGVGDLKEVVLHERSILAREGVVVVGIRLSDRGNELLKDPEVKALGLLYEKSSEEILADLKNYIKDIVASRIPSKREWEKMISQFFFDRLMRKPYVVVLLFNGEKNYEPPRSRAET
ncbi:MAG: Ribonuclease J 1 [candidate division WS2 bacterium]|nr:Ribonuclease J 1 [Candidatus Lithacetigena glycinireducens]